MSTHQPASVSGILFLSFQQACSNLEFYLDSETQAFLGGISPDGWYPLTQYNALLSTVAGRYANPGVVLEKVGEAMMQGWYHFGNGKQILRQGVDFLHHQTGSEGYHSLIRGPSDQVGDFSLTRLDLTQCSAEVHSTTPFDKDLERGVLKGGLALVGDLRLVVVDNSADPARYQISYVPVARPSHSVIDEVERFTNGPELAEISNLSPLALQELGYRYRELTDSKREQGQYWHAINETLSASLLSNQEQQKALAQSKRRADVLKNAIVDAAIDSVITVDTKGTIIEFNTSAEQLFGCARQDVLGQISVAKLLPKDIRSHIEEGTNNNIPIRGEIENGDSVSVPVDFLVRNVTFEGEGLTTIYIRDLTELVIAEREIARQRDALMQSEKLTALGSLLSGIAHELNNPLSIVSGRAMMLEQEFDDPALVGPLGKIRNASERCTRIVRNFLAMARQQPVEREELNLNDLIDDSLDLLGYQLRSSGIEVVKELDPDLPMTIGDGTQLSQVVTNLLINAQQSLCEQGSENRQIYVSTGRNDKGMLFARIRDNGSGVPPAIVERIFEPFFSTKTGTGSGIGLSLSHRLVTSHGGTLELEKTDFEGASFVMTVPLEIAPKTTTDAEVQAATKPTGHVLVVDDETEIADLVAEMLAKSGYTVQTANSGSEALELLAVTDFHAILADLHMPQMNGSEFADQAIRAYPKYNKRIGFITGDTLGASARQFLNENDSPFIEKPFSSTDVLDLLEVLKN